MQIVERFVPEDNPAVNASACVTLVTYQNTEIQHFSCLISTWTPCPNSTKLNCTLLRPLKGRTGPITGTIKAFYEVFYWVIWRSRASCTVWLLTALGLSLSFSPLYLSLTCRSSREVLQRRPLHHSVGVPHHKHLVQHRVVVDKALDHTRWLHILQVLFAEDNGHLWT